jgi:glucose-6-phosphate isomerase
MENIKLNLDNIYSFVSKSAVEKYEDTVKKHNLDLHNKNGKGSDFLGWVNLPSSIGTHEIKEIETTAASIKNRVDYLVVIGIGGSYLGAKAVNDALLNSFETYKCKHDNPVLIFAGQNIGEDYLYDLTSFLKDKSFAIVVISKSGTTTEPAIAFRLLKNLLEDNVGKDKAKDLIIAITDAKKGALRQLSENEGYKTYVIPDDVGGRYSVLTPVGLVPLAIGGFDVQQMVAGAKAMENITGPETPFKDNPAALYAAARNALYSDGKKIEILVNYLNNLHYLSEWWKQLYGESEGKENKGIFPASVDFTSDLHSMGQYIQEGERHLFETVISVKSPNNKLTIPEEKENLDNLNYIAGKRIDEVNHMAELGTSLAHIDGGVPNIRIEVPELNAYYLGQIMYFFEKACGISGYILDVNPFNQPGVEAYKSNMFALLEKPGFEKETEKIKKRLG